MKMRFLLLAAAMLAAGATLAQQGSREGIAQLKSVKGNVLLSREAGLATGGEAARVVEHTRVITTGGSEVVVVFDNGCEVHLKENQRFEVDSRKPCAALIASVESILQPAVVAEGTGAIGVFWPLVPAIGGAAVGGAVLKPSDPEPPKPLSPS